MKTLSLDVKLLEDRKDLDKLKEGDIIFLSLPNILMSGQYKGLGLYLGNKYQSIKVNLEFIPLHGFGKEFENSGLINSFPIRKEQIIFKSGAIFCEEEIIRQLTLNRVGDYFNEKVKLLNKRYNAK